MSESFHPGRDRASAGLRVLREDQAGVTLIELMTVIGMLGIAFTAAFFFYAGALNRTSESEARVNTLSELNIAGERIVRDVRESAKICSPGVEGANSLILSPPTSGTPCDPATRIVYDCTTNPGTCTRTEGGSSSLAVDGLVPGPEAPIFVSEGSNHVAIDLRAIPEDRDRAIAFQRGATLRNPCEAC